ncbi:MAG: prephenate dehydrogenase/arogenate dehydrogenase family protein [Candidatus Omnitrophota bacterium]
MVFRTQLFNRVTIVGVGLIGGSLGLAIRKHNIAREIFGVSRQSFTLGHALKMKAIDKGFHDIKEGVKHADFVILATPVGSIVGLLQHIGPYLKRNCIVTDVGSTKVSIVDAAKKNLPSPSFFVGSHPLTGSEKKGVIYAHDQLFENSTCVMTPTDITNRLARDKVKHFWTKIGAKVRMVSPDEHDQILAYISHLPHLLAFGLMEAVPPEFLGYATQRLKDTTRIASSSPQLWNDICLANAKHILKSLDEVVKNLSLYRKAIVTKDEKELTEHFQKAKTKRDEVDKNG